MTWTKETLDEERAGLFRVCLEALDEAGSDLVKGLAYAMAVALRSNDSIHGLPTEALLAVLNGEAVIVPKDATEEMYRVAEYTTSPYAEWQAMIAASPYVKRDRLDVGEYPDTKYSRVCPECQEVKRLRIEKGDMFTSFAPLFCGGDACKNDPEYLTME